MRAYILLLIYVNYWGVSFNVYKTICSYILLTVHGIVTIGNVKVWGEIIVSMRSKWCRMEMAKGCCHYGLRMTW